MHSSATHFFWVVVSINTQLSTVYLSRLVSRHFMLPPQLSFSHKKKHVWGPDWIPPSKCPKKPFCPTVLLIAAGFCFPPLLSIHTHVRPFFQVDLVWDGGEELWEMSAAPDWTLLFGAIRIKTAIIHDILCWHAAMLINQFPDLSPLLCWDSWWTCSCNQVTSTWVKLKSKNLALTIAHNEFQKVC